MKKIVFGMIAAAALFTAGCASTNHAANANAKPDSNSGVSVAGKKTTIVDWQGRDFGAKPMPDWLEPAGRSDFSVYKASVNMSDSKDYFIYSAYEMGAVDLRSATMRAETEFARTIARELNRNISVYSAESTKNGSMNEATRSAIAEETETQSHVKVSGARRAVRFWQEKIEEDPLTGSKTRKFAVYEIYQIPANTWAQTTVKYLTDVIGKLPEELKPEEQDVRDSISRMRKNAEFPTVMSQEEKRQSVELNKKMADFQIEIQKELAPAQQKAASDQALLQIMNEGKINQEKIIQDAKTERIKANADARKMAYASGNPVYAQAATITAEDKAWADAEAAALELLGY